MIFFSSSEQAKSILVRFLKGIAMGTANKIPGVSGGIVALASGFYEELIFTFKNFDSEAFKLFYGYFSHILMVFS